MFSDRKKKSVLIFFFVLFFVFTFSAVDYVLAQSRSAGVNINIVTTVPEVSATGSGTQIVVRWNWDFVSPGYYPPLVSEVLVTLTTDGINYTNLQSLNPWDFEATFTGLLPNIYTARVVMVDGNDYDYAAGPVDLGGGSNQRTVSETDFTVRGLAYPGPVAAVIFTYEGWFERVLSTNSAGVFEHQTRTLPEGSGTFSFSAQDPDGVLSAPVVFEYSLPLTTPIVVENVNMPPTIRIDNSVVTTGEVLGVSGYGYRDGSVSLVMSGPVSSAHLIPVDSNGFWNVDLPTAELIPGTYDLVAQSTSEDEAVVSPTSVTMVFQLTGGVSEFNVIAHPEKRSPAVGNWSLPSNLKLFQTGSSIPSYEFNFVTDNQGTMDVEAPQVTAGNYNFLLKGVSHLSKRLNNLSFQNDSLLLDYTDGGTFSLLAGDVHSSKDDYVNGLDLSATVIKLYSAFLDADLNLDGYVNGMDLSMVVSNLYLSGEGS